ncbi:MAG: DNA-directed RNA polymerase subunit alpha [Candidatus Zambryskibacteria bacterium RIFCSPLOWO2_02_FULL_51_21]|uniref:DNA-directed RNA polymerase subunit alpha n=1 Tax=Candidatus Zambryskibacteria bacterium RIFCSPHIGHO2_02_FULL_43_37 TaxID=1802749 RepID=A0A1G2TGY2_9BACT|nr:MAG: DNA-directed RNA polymerase subunit alpha [Candidatus Zambryskibacteria bacterium RIFCSPHIGHO2_01_FULL_52_18]OHA96547.1 MAG: DNA-directed RNA polymerase subunit alpha [Candidatus Zambryskibacteria bacterium RIFCSPHIGHO2_02_FULL_43_37]OHB07532.1 MAG: DNA-directed RNA polymerase subunit alpha [Candidatus Zambryskibacteria bacterium RIFCSPLOWO2_01_FULL_52_12]OHB11189.1 MAG: DNA-directed RNA polymerase subunit alpha [Candidatus Zambryskibacteria bacterium RIFCSPLOWO2_02_FULL_51_21]
MADYTIHLPSKPRVVSEEGESGIFEIEGLYPGYGHTLGNSLRRIILSSLPGVAITSVKIAGVSHEFSTLDGVKEDVVTILLNLKKVRMRFTTDEPQTLYLKAKGEKALTAKDLEVPGQVEILTPNVSLATLTSKSASIDMEIRAEKGLGFMPKEMIDKSRVDIGTIALDGIFTPIRRASYEVENMRVGDRTDFNKLRISIETDGTITPTEALTYAIEVMINQLKAVVGFKEELPSEEEPKATISAPVAARSEVDPEVLKTRVESLDISSRAQHALADANIRTVGGLARKKEKDLLEIEGLGAKGIQEIRKALGEYGITLK